MRRSVFLALLAAGSAFVSSCTDTTPSTGPTSAPADPLHTRTDLDLGAVPASFAVQSCGLAENAAMRFSSPGFVNGTTVGLYVRFAGMPAREKTLRIWWDWENRPDVHEDISLTDDDPVVEVIEHTFSGASVGDERKVRVELIVEDTANECIRVRTVELTPAVVEEPVMTIRCGGGTSKCVFVTSTLTAPTFASLGAGDAICQGLASGAGIPGTFMAWISGGMGSPSTRFTPASVPYKLTDGTVIANDWADLIDGTLAHPINMTENCAAAPGTEVWTGTHWTGGAFFSGPVLQNCMGWTGFSFGRVGNSGSATVTWTSSLDRPCAYAPVLPLYCFEQ